MKPQGLPKRAQGLPINFIVLIAIGVFVLILVILFFLSGSQSTNVVSQQAAYNACNSKCSSEIQYVQMGGTYPKSSSPFCVANYSISGMTANVKCDSLIGCKVNDTCILKCGTRCTGGTTDSATCC
jgi:hypothetical protein